MDPNQGKVIEKLISTQIPTSLHTSTLTTSTIMTSKPLNKGEVIGSSIGGSSGSSLRPPPFNQDKSDRGKGIVKYLLKEEKKKNVEKETEKNADQQHFMTKGRILQDLRRVIR